MDSPPRLSTTEEQATRPPSMLGVVFQNTSLRDCLQYFGKRDMLRNHLVLSMQGDTDILGKRLGLDSLQYGRVPIRTKNYGVASDMSDDKERP